MGPCDMQLLQFVIVLMVEEQPLFKQQNNQTPLSACNQNEFYAYLASGATDWRISIVSTQHTLFVLSVGDSLRQEIALVILQLVLVFASTL